MSASVRKRRNAAASFDSAAQPTIADLLRPRTLAELSFHKDTLDARLCNLVSTNAADMPNLLFYGPKGAGKQTRVHALLNEIYRGMGPSKNGRHSDTPVSDTSEHRTLRIDCSHTKRDRSHAQNSTLKAAGNSFLGGSGGGGGGGGHSGGAAVHVDIDCVMSAFHIELTPADVDGKDVFVIQQCVKHVCTDMMPLDVVVRSSVAQSGSAEAVCAQGKDNAASSAKNACQKKWPAFRTIVIRGADRLRFDAQAAMRRYMESHALRVRFVLVCEQFASVIPALRSRSLCLRVPAPSDLALAKLLTTATRKLRVGGRFGGERERWTPRYASASQHYFNEKNDRGALPVPTMSLLLQEAYNDATYAQTLLVTNHTPPAGVGSGAAATRPVQKRARKRAPTKSLLSAANGGTEVVREMALTDRDALIVPSWIATMRLLARVLVRGYAAVKNNRALLDAWAVEECGPATYHVPMLEWARRVAHELISRCVPLRRMMQVLLMALLNEIDALRDATHNGTQQPSAAVDRHATPVLEAWEDTRCDALRERVVDLLAAYEQRLAAPFRAVVPLDALFVHLSDACERQRANVPLLDSQSSVAHCI